MLEQCENLDVFQKKSIRNLIEYKYPAAMEWTVKKLMIPYLVYLILFCLYANAINPYKHLYAEADGVMKILLILMSSYFISNEAN